MIRPNLLATAAALGLLLSAGAAHSQPGGESLEALLGRLVAEQDATALADAGDFYSYYELGAFDPATFDEAAAIDALEADLPDNRALDCNFAAYYAGERSREGIVRLLTGAGQTIEAERIGALPAGRMVGVVLRSWEGTPGDIVDCNVSLGRFYFDNGQVLTAYYDGRRDLAATAPNTPSVTGLAPLGDFRSDRVRSGIARGAGD